MIQLVEFLLLKAEGAPAFHGHECNPFAVLQLINADQVKGVGKGVNYLAKIYLV